MIKTALVSLLALAWVLLSSHCRIEALPGLAFLSCGSEVYTAGLTPTGGHDQDHESNDSNECGDPCTEKGCCSIESAKFHAPRQHDVAPVAPATLIGLVPSDGFGPFELSIPVEVGRGLLTATPPELPSSWQFFLRAALPVRAPSLAS